MNNDLLSGKGIYVLSILLILHWTIMLRLVDTGLIEYEQSRLFVAPVPLVLALLSFLYAYGTQKSIVTPIPENNERRYMVVLLAVVAVSAILTAPVLLA